MEMNQQHGDKSYYNATPTFGVSTCDIDQNGFPDILTSSNNGYYNKLWFNLFDPSINYRHFRDYAKETGYASDNNGARDRLGGGHSFVAVCADYNNDGLMDVYSGELFHSHDNESKDKSALLTGSRSIFPPKFLRTEYINDDGKNKLEPRGSEGFLF